jgi:probable rRNA maturation factor
MDVEVLVSDEQTDQPVPAAPLVDLARLALDSEGVTAPAELALRFVDADTIAALNEEFLGHEGPTDVLSFAIEDEPLSARGDDATPLLVGDVVICPSVAFANAPEHAGTYRDELELLVVHGILHLLGRDHEIDGEAEAMEAREREILSAYRAAAHR